MATFAVHIIRASTKCSIQRALLQQGIETTLSKFSRPSLILASSGILQRKFTLTPYRPSGAEAEYKKHNHVWLWNAEKILSVSLLGILPAAVISPMPALDYLMALSLTLHTHWGIEAIVVDYVRESVVGSAMAKLGPVLVYAMSAFILGSLCYFNYSDVGLGNAIRMFWKL